VPVRRIGLESAALLPMVTVRRAGLGCGRAQGDDEAGRSA
jgi:hypothetical protein